MCDVVGRRLAARDFEAIGRCVQTTRQVVGTVVQTGLKCARIFPHATRSFCDKHLSRRSAQKLWAKRVQHLLRFTWCLTLACTVATAALVVFPGTCVYVLTSSAPMYTQIGWVSTVVVLDILTVLLMGATHFWSMIQSFVTAIASFCSKNRSQQAQPRSASGSSAGKAAWKLHFNTLKDSALSKLTAATLSVAGTVLKLFKVHTAISAAAQPDHFASWKQLQSTACAWGKNCRHHSFAL